MLDFKTQSQMVDATASIMRAYMRAATNTAAASASRSFALWTAMLEAATVRRGPAGRPEPGASSFAHPSWPWLPGSAPVVSWPPLAQSWWLGPSLTFWAPLAEWGGWSRGPFPVWSGWYGAAQVLPSPAAVNGATRPAPDAGFASYRSAGGHAAAQVIVPAMELASVTATTALAPMQTMLGVRRAARDA